MNGHCVNTVFTGCSLLLLLATLSIASNAQLGGGVANVLTWGLTRFWRRAGWSEFSMDTSVRRTNGGVAAARPPSISRNFQGFFCCACCCCFSDSSMALRNSATAGTSGDFSESLAM